MKSKINTIREKLLLEVDDEINKYNKFCKIQLNHQLPKEIQLSYPRNFTVTFSNPTMCGNSNDQNEENLNMKEKSLNTRSSSSILKKESTLSFPDSKDLDPVQKKVKFEEIRKNKKMSPFSKEIIHSDKLRALLNKMKRKTFPKGKVSQSSVTSYLTTSRSSKEKFVNQKEKGKKFSNFFLQVVDNKRKKLTDKELNLNVHDSKMCKLDSLFNNNLMDNVYIKNFNDESNEGGVFSLSCVDSYNSSVSEISRMSLSVYNSGDRSYFTSASEISDCSEICC